ncbi:MAG: CPBP family intramembrane metalloprotease [Bacteroidales bacterium]|nr:CPBP family intramembrane metalloprotease [Bacteroidales bacterium]
MYLKQSKEGLTDWWRYAVILCVVIVLNFMAGLPLAVVSLFKTIEGNASLPEFANSFDPAALGLSKNMLLLLMMAPLSLVFFGLTIAIKYIHGYSFTQVFTSSRRFRWNRFFMAALIWFAFLALSDVAYYLMYPETYEFHFNFREFMVLILICVLFLPMQASWEELYFRGNLLQGLGLLSRSRVAALIFSSAIFGLVHYFNPEVKEYGTVNAMINYVGFGLLLGITVIMDGGLEMAFGLHTINNFYAAVFVSYSGSVLNTPALISSNHVDGTYMAIAFVVAAILFLLLAKKVFRWKSYKWLMEPLYD